jgi:nucleotide-binding universal stress UspA family protein
MLKRILVVIDGSKTASIAKRYALDLAKQFKADLTGVGVIDTPWITAAQPEPLGGAAYKIRRDSEVIKLTHKRLQGMLEEFSRLCEENGIKHAVQELEGFPATEIEKLSQEHDLIVMGRTTDFHFEDNDDNDLTVKYITRDNPRPIIVVTGESHGSNVLIAYDGSLQAARALHMYLLLGLAKDKKIHVLSIAHRKRAADEIAKRAEEMCKSHNVKVTAEGVASRHAPEHIIKKKADEINASMIIMGAFGHHGLREFFLGSCTEHMIQQSGVPLFIHH